jgi:DNA polymerase I-like protein with 3'-5' exonuclease and polymerase domains
MGLAYIDWSTQEFGIAAALSGDGAMIAAYESGDPYLEFGKQIGALPPDATKETHKAARQLYKACILGIGYGMGAQSLAQRINRLPIEARTIVRAYHETYRTFIDWSDITVDHAMLTGSLHTRFGWHVHAGPNANPRSLRNFPMQANAAEMMRLAACFATESGIEVCAPVHDAFLICAPLERLDEDIAQMRAAMAKASRAVLAGFEIRSDVHRVHYPDRYMDERGVVMWERVLKLIARCRKARRAA